RNAKVARSRFRLRSRIAPRRHRAVCKWVYGNVARVVYSRLFPGLRKLQTGRLNKSPHDANAFANRYSLKKRRRNKQQAEKDPSESVASASSVAHSDQYRGR